MNHSSKIDTYLARYGVRPRRPLRTASLAGVERVVVIPALAEQTSLFRTLAALAANPPAELAKTLVMCVVNNHPPPLADPEAIADNQRTLSVLSDLLHGLPRRAASLEVGDDFGSIVRSGLRLGWIDASSPGCEIPEGDGGVGTARKIGMDAALELLAAKGEGRAAIFCLDADTLVQENYLAAVSAHFSGCRDAAAVTGYAHRMPQDPLRRAAICQYEIFLRSYVIGLSLAGSPYAFHAIGSTMACTAQAYLDVRGMNRRTAAEDFHFLNKSAKIGGVGTIAATTVFPSPRESARVPFGTGRAMLKVAGGEGEWRLHDPRIFTLLGQWLAAVGEKPDRDAGGMLAAAMKIHPQLAAYLEQNGFDAGWRNIRRNFSDESHLVGGFHVWFDGLKTLRFVHHLSRTAFPPVPLVRGLSGLLDRAGSRNDVVDAISRESGSDAPFGILEALRQGFPGS